jgi:hypothetical protein
LVCKPENGLASLSKEFSRRPLFVKGLRELELAAEFSLLVVLLFSVIVVHSSESLLALLINLLNRGI